MKLKFLLALALLLLAISARVARADLGFWSNALVGTWRHPRSGDVYRFRSDATYEFVAGPRKAKAGELSHSGWWKIAQPTRKESGGSQEGPVALVIKARKRTVAGKGGTRTLATKRDFRLVVNTVLIDGKGMTRELYRIDGVTWKRVR